METDRTQRILAVIEQETGKVVTADTRLSEVVEESLEFLDLILQIEKVFACKFTDEQIAGFEKVADIELALAA